MERLLIVSLLIIILALVPLLFYSFKTDTEWSPEDEAEEATVSLCQVHVQSEDSNLFDDQTLLSMLARLKMHDFQIGQPVWGPSSTRLYLCEYPLKAGFKQSVIDNELSSIIKNNGDSSKRFAWSCA